MISGYRLSKLFGFAFMLLGWGKGLPLRAQSAQDSVRQTVQTLMKGMLLADSSMIRQAFTEQAVLQTIKSGGAQGTPILQNESVDEFVQAVGKLKPGVADEQVEFGAVHLDGDLASVWTPYRFFRSGQFSHCGVNSFQLVRGEKGWKIQYLIDTRRKQPCW
ncbi:MAG: hypothetical protein ACKO6K_11000 [Chitinophagaceae bacterium]